MCKLKFLLMLVGVFLFSGTPLFASEANLAIPDLHEGTFHVFGIEMSSWDFLAYGALVITGTLFFSLFLFFQIKKLPAHNSMLKVAATIYKTCSTYLKQTTGKIPVNVIWIDCNHPLCVFLWFVGRIGFCSVSSTTLFHCWYGRFLRCCLVWYSR